MDERIKAEITRIVNTVAPNFGGGLDSSTMYGQFAEEVARFAVIWAYKDAAQIFRGRVSEFEKIIEERLKDGR